MGASYRSKLIVGVKWDQVVTVHKEQTSTKKFHEDTGEPYSLIDEKDTHWIGDVNYGDFKSAFNFLETHGFPDFPREGLGIWPTDYEGRFLGIQLVNFDVNCGGHESFTIEQLQELVNQVRSTLLLIGCKAEPTIHPIAEASA
jgi:hypothetical protein